MINYNIFNKLLPDKNIIVIRDIDIFKDNNLCLFCYKTYPIECKSCRVNRDTLIIFILPIKQIELDTFFINKSNILLLKELQNYIQYTYDIAQVFKDNSYRYFESRIKQSQYFVFIVNYINHIKTNNNIIDIRYIILPQHTSD